MNHAYRKTGLAKPLLILAALALLAWLVLIPAAGALWSVLMDQSVMIYLALGVLLVAAGVVRQKSSNPKVKAAGKVNIATGLILIGVIIWMYVL